MNYLCWFKITNPYDWPIAIHLDAKGAINEDKMVTKVFDLDHWREAFEAMMAGKELKVLIASNPDDETLTNINNWTSMIL